METNPLLQKLDVVSSFEKAIDLIDGYQTRSLEDNLRVLKACGRYSPGTVLCRNHPLFSQVDAFVKYLNSIPNEAFDSDKIGPVLIIRSIWALSRLGYAPSTSTPSHLVNALIQHCIPLFPQLSPSEMSLLLKSLGKMKLSIPEKDYAVFIHAVYNDRNEFSLTELIDAIWGISRMGEENSSTWKLMDSPVSQEIDTLFRITEDLVTLNPTLVKSLRASYLVNLIYSFSYLHHPDTKELMSQLLDAVCSRMSKYTPLELSILYRAYVEVGTVSRDLDRAVVKFVQKRHEEMNSSVALSLLYSYSRYHRSSQRPADKDLVASLLDIIHSHLDGCSLNDQVYLLCCYNNLNLFPASSLQMLFERMAPRVAQMDDMQAFYTLMAIAKAKVDSDAERTITDALQRRYLASGDTSSRTVGIDCMLLRIDASRDRDTKPIVDHLLVLYRSNPQAFSARAICQVLFNTNRKQDLDAPTVVSLVKRFAALCAEKKAVTPQDIAYTLSSVQPYLRRDRSFLLPMTLSMGVAAWCQQNPAAVSPDFISDVLMNLAKMRMKPTVLLRLFEDKFADNLSVFSDENKLKLLKAFAMTRYQNQVVINFLLEQLALVVPTMSNKDALSLLWCVSQIAPSRSEVVSRIVSEMDGRALTESEKKNMNNIRSVLGSS